MKTRTYSVTDDSGFLALVDPNAYSSFVDSEWTLDQLVQHFKMQMRDGRLVIWGTGREDIWQVEVGPRRSASAGFREFRTTIRASGEHLLLTNYESLTMAAQFADVKLPERHQRELLISVESGKYECRIVQRHDPAHPQSPRDKTGDFAVELTSVQADGGGTAMTEIPWARI